MYKFIDLCAGIGGFHLAFKNAGAQCVLSCEIDKFAQTTYFANFSNEILFEKDIKLIDEKTMPSFDILCAGFPCQSFSLAGKRFGFEDTRGTIFFDIVRILKEKSPKGFLLENVKNLKNHDGGKTLKVIEEELINLNYHIKIFTIDSKYFVPQKRERVYIVGLNKKHFTEEEFSSLVQNISNEYNNKKQLFLPNFWNILEDNVDKEFVLSDRLWEFLQEHANKHAKKGNGFGFGLMTEKDITARTLTARYYKDGSEILIKQENNNPRKLTPRECARLMGFPEDFKIPVSKTQAYKQFGNSVVVPVVEMFAQHMIKTFTKN